MVDVPIHAQVECADGACGHTVGVIMDPIAWQVTHFVMQESGLSHVEHLVPVCSVLDSTPDLVRLSCNKSDLAVIQPLVESEHKPIERSAFVGRSYAGRYGWPYVFLATLSTPTKHENIPPGELIVRRGARVKATDGQVGRVDEFLVDPATRNITHLVLRQGVLRGHKDVMIPISAIERAGEHVVYLKLDRNAVESLPAIPVGRWHGRKAA
jgi:hypothetical protein